MLAYLQTFFAHLTNKEEGQDLTEYALLVAVIALVVVAAAIIFGSQLSSWFANISAKIPLT